MVHLKIVELHFCLQGNDLVYVVVVVVSCCFIGVGKKNLVQKCF